jgi:hypothetical protein
VISLFTGGLAEMRTTYNYVFYQGENTDTISMFINSVLFEICISFVAIMVGYMIRIIFYRLNRLGKIFVGAGLPVLLFFVIPMLDYILFNGTITTTFATLLYTLLSTPLRAFGTILIAFAVCAGISYLLMRRAVVNK